MRSTFPDGLTGIFGHLGPLRVTLGGRLMGLLRFSGWLEAAPPSRGLIGTIGTGTRRGGGSRLSLNVKEVWKTGLGTLVARFLSLGLTLRSSSLDSSVS